MPIRILFNLWNALLVSFPAENKVKAPALGEGFYFQGIQSNYTASTYFTITVFLVWLNVPASSL